MTWDKCIERKPYTSLAIETVVERLNKKPELYREFLIDIREHLTPENSDMNGFYPLSSQLSYWFTTASKSKIKHSHPLGLIEIASLLTNLKGNTHRPKSLKRALKNPIFDLDRWWELSPETQDKYEKATNGAERCEAMKEIIDCYLEQRLSIREAV